MESNHALVPNFAFVGQSRLSSVLLCSGNMGQRHSESSRTEVQHGEEIQYTCLRSALNSGEVERQLIR